jgi:hypothetical protein
MKKLLLISMLFIGINLFAQENIKLKYYKDVMTEKEYVFSNEKILCLENPEKGFMLSILYDFKKGKVKYSGIKVFSHSIGSCLEHDKLIFLFEDDSKMELMSWNDFNCEGRSYFDFNGDRLIKLTKRIKAIRFQNGRSYESVTVTLENEIDKTYFIDAQLAIDKQLYEVVDKM